MTYKHKNTDQTHLLTPRPQADPQECHTQQLEDSRHRQICYFWQLRPNLNLQRSLAAR